MRSWTTLKVRTKSFKSLYKKHQISTYFTVHLTNGSGLSFRSMVSLDINLSGTLNSSIVTAEENTSVETSPNESNMDAVEQNKSETESNAYEESEPEDETDEANADKKLKNATYGHSFEIDISSIFPRKRRLKHVILDVKKTNEKCFLYCVAAGLEHHKFQGLDEKENPNNYVNFINEKFNIEGIEFPIKMDQIQQFVKQNSHLNISINIYTILAGQVKSVMTNITCSQKESPIFIDLLAVFPHSTENESCAIQNGHFILISDPCKFFTERQKSLKKRIRQRIVCPNCKIQFVSKESDKFKNHRHFCSNKHAQIQDLPGEDEKLEFGGRLLNAQYLENICIFYDFECVLKSADNENCGDCISICKCEADSTKKITIPKQIHEPIIYSYVILDKNGSILEQCTEYCPRGDAGTKFLSVLLSNQERYLSYGRGPKKYKKVPHVSFKERRKIFKKQNGICLHCHEKIQPGQRRALDRM